MVFQVLTAYQERQVLGARPVELDDKVKTANPDHKVKTGWMASLDRKEIRANVEFLAWLVFLEAEVLRDQPEAQASQAEQVQAEDQEKKEILVLEELMVNKVLTDFKDSLVSTEKREEQVFLDWMVFLEPLG